MEAFWIFKLQNEELDFTDSLVSCSLSINVKHVLSFLTNAVEQMMGQEENSTRKGRWTLENRGVLKRESLPRSVLGPASNCLNLSRRDASLSVMAGVPDVFWSAMRATSGMTGGR